MRGSIDKRRASNNSHLHCQSSQRSAKRGESVHQADWTRWRQLSATSDGLGGLYRDYGLPAARDICCRFLVWSEGCAGRQINSWRGHDGVLGLLACGYIPSSARAAIDDRDEGEELDGLASHRHSRRSCCQFIFAIDFTGCTELSTQDLDEGPPSQPEGYPTAPMSR